MIALLKKIPWWAWIGGLVALLLLWQSLSGWAASRKLYNMALDQLREDQANVIEAKEEWIKTCEDEILRLEAEKERIKKEKAIVQKQAVESAVEVARLKGKIGELQTQLQNIVVSDDPDRILDDLRRMGFSSVRRKP